MSLAYATPMWASGVFQSCDQMTGTGSPDARHAASVLVNAPGMIRSPPLSTLPNTATNASNSPAESVFVAVVNDLR